MDEYVWLQKTAAAAQSVIDEISHPAAESEDAPLAKLPGYQDEARPSDAVGVGKWGEDLEIPAFLLKAEDMSGPRQDFERAIYADNCDEREPDRYQTNGPCVECGIDTENTDDGDHICEGCLEEARAATREDQRLDDPRHTPYRTR